MVYTVKHPNVKLIMPPVDVQEKLRWDRYKHRILGIWPGEDKPVKQPVTAELEKTA